MSMELIGSKLPLEAARRIDALCREFERAWRGGEQPRLEEFLDRAPPAERETLFDELLRLEVELRLTSSDTATRSDLCRRFPEAKQRVAEVCREIAEDLPLNSASAAAGGVDDDGAPPAVGRYRIERLLGEGAFGRVYMATDGELHRSVAVKLSRRPELGRPTAYDVFLAEARILARFDHPSIVPVYDVGRLGDGRIYIVTKLIEGATLAERLADSRPTPIEAAEWMATVAEALHSAHEQGLVHRDVKPTNLLLDTGGSIYVGDFGLALCEENYGAGPAMVGTPAYMSPEQARGEGHRVDARSDVFSLGVVLYELLTGLRPFRADTRREILEQILIVEPRSPRQLNRKVPRELERACLRALSKRAADRFESAREMADDLRRFLKGAGNIAAPPAVPASQPAFDLLSVADKTASLPQRVVPKGLRSFAAEDADFFLGLLPGPRDREGLPLSIQFWRRRIERRDQDTLAVGLLYGPSGCGKSSLVNAGIVPRLAEHVVVISLEASTDDTETRLLRALSRRFPALAAERDLLDAFTALRRGGILPPDKKLLVVLDQFEQWLHGRVDYSSCDLTRALRQCDGGQLQCLLLIRDDFWLAANRFMRELEIPILEDHNSALVDLFDLRHARAVLAAFGQAYGTLPDNPADWTREQHAFLEQAVAGLARDDKIVCVRLAVFAEMVKDKVWSPAFLNKAGGLEGIGEAFLEDVFAARSAPPHQRLHAPAARAVLRALLPEEGVEIKGHLRTEDELRQRCGYTGQPQEFESLMALLDSKLHLISAVESAGDSQGSQAAGAKPAVCGPACQSAPLAGDAPAHHRCYQLTHDYLVPSLRAWLTRKQRETRRGRAELCLAERAAWWQGRADQRHLPTAWEWVAIRLWTSRRRWNETERRMMRGASRHYLRRAALLTVVWVMLTCAALAGLSWQHAGSLVDGLLTADTKEVPGLIGELDDYRYFAEPRLAAIVESSDSGPRQRLHASLALLPSDAGQLVFLRQQLIEVDLANFLVLRGVLHPRRAEIVDWLWRVAEAPATPADQRMRAACALSAFAADDADRRRWAELAPIIARQVVTQAARAPAQFGPLVEVVRPAREFLVPPLMDIFRDRDRTEPELLLTTSLLLELDGDRPELLADLLFDADAKRFATILPVASTHDLAFVPLLHRELETLDPPRPFTSEEDEQAKDLRAERQANAALALFQLGHQADVWPLLNHTADPRRRTFIIDRLAAYGIEAAKVIERLSVEREASCRRALLLALGEYSPRTLSANEFKRAIAQAQTLYQNDPDAGVHGAAEWLLRHWQEKLPPITAAARLGQPPGWYVNGQGQTMIVVPGPADFPIELLESRDQEPQSFQARIERPFAIGGTEVTMAQYARSLGGEVVADENLVQGGVSWYDAARYCNWLSRVEGIPPEQWCYVASQSADGSERFEAADDFTVRTGYRLPTEAEWDYACRAGSVTPRFYGNAVELLPKYAWYYVNSDERRHAAGLLRPNDWGLFDVYGNLWEWCHDLATDTMPSVAKGSDLPERLLRGAPYTARPWFLYSSWRSSDAVATRDELNGFRVARTMPSNERAGAAAASLRVIRSGVYTFNAWYHQTGVRRAGQANEPHAGTGFRVARTQPR